LWNWESGGGCGFEVAVGGVSGAVEAEGRCMALTVLQFSELPPPFTTLTKPQNKP